ncbi:MAG TPA: adenylyltransferase/cytidyltransferase family protein, partial [Elusimicrobiales bacterium]|nr:adenylyltransferase/cytidyltransferase family protein [Elusimicrobiales bacterium]
MAGLSKAAPVRARKLLVFGGSFNPPHRAHAALLKAALKAIKPELALVVPAYHSPLKGLPGTPAAQRLKMLRVFLKQNFKGLPVRVDTGELKSGRKVYTWQTLSRIRKNFSGEIYLLLGSDCLAQFHKWKRPLSVARLAKL